MDKLNKEQIQAMAEEDAKTYLTSQAWLRQTGETAKAYKAFKTFLNMEPENRSVLAAYRLHAGKPDAKRAIPSFYQWFHKYRWNDRVMAFDSYVDFKESRDLAEERLKVRRNRRVALSRILTKYDELVQRIDTGQRYSPRDIGEVMLKTIRELREEYDDEPAKRHEVTAYNGGVGGFASLAQRSADLTDEELAAEYRAIAKQTPAITHEGES